jgi:CHAT domain-containing protein
VKSYRDLDLELTGWSRDEAGRETLRVRVVSSPGGEQRRSEEVEVFFDASLRDSCAALGRRELDLAGMFALGRQLGDLLMPPAARAFYDRSRARLRDGEGLRLRIRFDTWAVADVPWEFALLPPAGRGGDEADAAGFLALNPRLSIVRYEPLSEPLETLAPVEAQKLRLVAVLSTPSADPEWPPLALEAEARGLEKALAERPEIELVERRDATLPDLEDAISGGAHIFHFAGHGRFAATLGERIGETVGRGFLVLRDAAGHAAEVAADTLVVNLQGRGVRLAVLGACEGAKRDAVNPWTGIAPALVRGGLPAVVAMQATLRDESAVAFSARFYRALAEGEPIDAAVAAGRLAIFNQGGAAERDWGTPVLYLRAASGVLFPVVSEEEEAVRPLGRIGWTNVGLSTAVVALVAAAFYFFARPRFPNSWVVGSGASALTLGSLALGWLTWVAGDDVRRSLRKLLRKRVVMGALAIGALLLSATAYALATQTHLILRILPGTTLWACLAEPCAQPAGNPSSLMLF